MSESTPQTDTPPQTGHPRIDAALAAAAAATDTDSLTRALEVLQSVLDTDPEELDGSA